MVKLIGLGSPFGADRIGWKVIERLKPSFPEESCMRLDRPGLRLLEELTGVECVGIIDAVKSSHPPGAVHFLNGKEIEASTLFYSSHGIGLAQTLQLGLALNLLPKHVWLAGITIDDGGEVWTHLDKIVEVIKKWWITTRLCASNPPYKNF